MMYCKLLTKSTKFYKHWVNIYNNSQNQNRLTKTIKIDFAN